MRRNSLIASLIVLLLGGAGCASIFSSGPDPVSFGSEPDGADVLVNGVKRGNTPVTLELHPDEQYVITLRKQGYEDATFSLSTHVQGGWVVLDILAGIIGVAVDAGTGEWKAFDSGDHYVTLEERN